MKSNSLLRVGGIGCGSMFQGHAQSYAEIYGAKLVAFYDVNAKNAELSKRNYENHLKDLIEGRIKPKIRPTVDTPYSMEEWVEELKENLNNLKVYSDWSDLLENIDLADVCTPPKWHPYYALKALERNVNVTTEKPPGISWWIVSKLREAVKKSKAIYQCTDDNIFLEVNNMFRSIIESGEIGEVNLIHRVHGSFARYQEALANRWFFDPEIAGGGALMDYGSHDIASVWFIAGYDKRSLEIKSQGIESKIKMRSIGGSYQRSRVDDDAHVKALFEDPTSGNPIIVSFETSWIEDKFRYVTIIGSEGEATDLLDQNGDHVIRITRKGFGQKVFKVPKNVIQQTPKGLQDFVMCIREGRKPLPNEEVAIGVMEILGSAYLSELRGRVAVRPDEFREFCEQKAAEHPEDPELAIVKELMKPYS